MLRLAVLAVVIHTVGCVGCADPIGSWELAADSSAMVALDSDEFERAGQLVATFTLPDEDSGAFYRVDAQFVRGGAPVSANERVYVRAVPRFESFDGVAEVTTFLIDDGSGTLSAPLTAQRSLGECSELADCTQEVSISLGWLAPPPERATLAIEARVIVELRGSGQTEPPAGAAAVAELTL